MKKISEWKEIMNKDLDRDVNCRSIGLDENLIFGMNRIILRILLSAEQRQRTRRRVSNLFEDKDKLKWIGYKYKPKEDED